MIYKIRLNDIEKIKKFVNRIFKIDSEALMRSKDCKFCVDAKSIMGIFSLDLSEELILEISNIEDEFIKDIKAMNIYIEPLEVIYK